MNAVVLILVLPLDLGGIGLEPLPSQRYYPYRHGCTPANRHCERCRQDGCGRPCYDFRRNFDYPWHPPYHRPVLEDVPYDFSPRIIPLSEIPAAIPYEELPQPPRNESSPSDKPRGK
jgi:hypothetical protein